MEHNGLDASGDESEEPQWTLPDEIQVCTQGCVKVPLAISRIVHRARSCFSCQPKKRNVNIDFFLYVYIYDR